MEHGGLFFYGDVDNLFGSEIRFAEVEVDRCDLVPPIEGLEFFVEVTPFEADETIGDGIVMARRDVFLHQTEEVGSVHDSTADNEVVEAVFVHYVAVGRLNICESERLSHLVDHLDFLANRVDEVELALGEEDGEGNAGEATTRANIEDGSLGLERYVLRNAEGVEHVVLVERGHIPAGDDIDFGIPVVVEPLQLGELLDLQRGEVGEVFENLFQGRGELD